jgi:hypothetical protein
VNDGGQKRRPVSPRQPARFTPNLPDSANPPAAADPLAAHRPLNRQVFRQPLRRFVYSLNILYSFAHVVVTSRQTKRSNGYRTPLSATTETNPSAN